jgi:hypothetical protein
MPLIDAYRPEDAKPIVAMYRRVFGNDAAEANRLRWEWQYNHNPNNPAGGPLIWVAREGQTIVGQYATMPVRLQASAMPCSGGGTSTAGRRSAWVCRRRHLGCSRSCAGRTSDRYPA